MNALLVDTAGERPVMVPGEQPDPVPGERELLVGVKATAVKYKQEDFREVIARAWGPACIDLIIDPVGAPYWERNIDLLGMDGRLVLLAFMGGSKVDEVRLSSLLRKRLTVRGSTLRNRPLAYKITLTQDFQAKNLDLLEQGRLQPVIDSVFDWTEAEKAHQRMEQNLNAGKLVLAGF